MRPGGHHRGPLFWRIYLHGVLLLLVVGVAVLAVAHTLGRGRGFPPVERLASYAATRVADAAGTPGRMDEELRRLRDELGIEGTVYGRNGRPIATSTEPPLEPFGPGALKSAGPVRVRGRGAAWAVPLPAVGGHLVVAGPPLEHDPARGLLFIGAVLVALALASFPLARSISAPLETLTAAARTLGAGDLSARANLKARGEVGELGRAFDEMAGRLEALVRSERELLANVSHELRTPLARMRVALELAAEGDRERAQRHLAEIGSDLQELDALIDDVLTAARLDASRSGAWTISRDPVDLAAVAREAAHRFQGDHPNRAIEVEADATGTETVGDAALLRRLLRILLDNAAKYSDPASAVKVSVRPTAQGASLTVQDHGIGIDPVDLPRLFTPFFRTERSRAHGTRGTGLGLALARRIAETHGGTIRAESVPGADTTFLVELPRS